MVAGMCACRAITKCVSVCRANSNSQQLVLRLSSPTDQGFKLTARKGTQTQEVFVVSDLEAETLEAAIAWAL